VPTNEYVIQQLMAAWFEEEGLISDSPPVVAATPNAGNPHYLPTATVTRAIASGDLVLLDLWGKLDQPRAVYADISWVGYLGRVVPDVYANAFRVIRDARDAAVRLVEERTGAGAEIRGYEVDRAASAVIRDAGYAAWILHRTGHSLGVSVHGNGVNMDDYETHDDRRLLPGTGFTIEPGVYSADFGMRTEINMVVRERDAMVTGPRQSEILALA
jgi:Xaa-Pro aminopeptidase